MVEAAKDWRGWRSIVQAVARGRHQLDSTRRQGDCESTMKWLQCREKFKLSANLVCISIKVNAEIFLMPFDRKMPIHALKSHTILY